ncbi:hypothetical protein SLEP1_g27226 [Rubroshorea leprosula]|uniref:Carboxypeptidase n=1 Tax=Rubroshorea leprosula TaxID=152421 RepID=A0AAV5JZ23_9ROSI|nr:hypothetical protein SLEP1_g27226 [Rubroshorea leprosula]
MDKLYVFLFSVLFSASLSHGAIGRVRSSRDGLEDWGYVQVRPKAHMFWLLYRSPYRVENPSKPWPIILWLQGGPGSSGVGIGNFEEIGPLDTNLNPRNSTWLKKADLLFVDNPVGTGYSFVEKTNLFVKTDEEAATDLTTMLMTLFNKNEELQKSPLYIVAESYGGKFAVTLGLSAIKAIEAGKLKLKLGGVALGDSWISPEDFVFSWGSLLKDVSRLDNNGLQQSNSLAEEIKQQLRDGKYVNATSTWTELEDAIFTSSNYVDLYNFLLDLDMDPVSMAASEISDEIALSKYSRYLKKYSRYLSSLRSAPGGNGSDLDSLMNGVIRKKLKIPSNISWGGQSDYVFSNLAGDFMKPRINEKDKFQINDINFMFLVDVLNCISLFRWEGLQKYKSRERTPLYCGNDKVTKGFTKSYKNFHFYWILGAGHFVPVDQPCVALNMVGAVTHSPAA